MKPQFDLNQGCRLDEIKWKKAYGHFPDIKKMVDFLKSVLIRVNLWLKLSQPHKWGIVK